LCESKYKISKHNTKIAHDPNAPINLLLSPIF